MISEDTRQSLEDHGFDVCWELTDAQLEARHDKRAPLAHLVAAAEAFYKKCVKPDWLPKDKAGYLSPVKGIAKTQPDRLIYRHVVEGTRVELVAGEFSVVVNLGVSNKNRTVDSEAAAKDLYEQWVARLVSLDATMLKEPVEVTATPDFWLVRRVLFEPTSAGGSARRYFAWSWPESVSMAIDRKGNWLSLAIQRLPDRMDSLPKGGGARAGSGWFDDWVAPSPRAPAVEE